MNTLRLVWIALVCATLSTGCGPDSGAISVTFSGNIKDYVLPVLHAPGASLQICLGTPGSESCGDVVLASATEGKYQATVEVDSLSQVQTASLLYNTTSTANQCTAAADRSVSCQVGRKTFRYTQDLPGTVSVTFAATLDWDLNATSSETDAAGTPIHYPIKSAKASSYKCLPDIQSHEPWLGADGGFSIPLDNGTSIFMFGDTVIGTFAQGIKTFVGDSIGVSTCQNGNWDLRYIWNHKPDGSDDAFFQSSVSDLRYWPTDSFKFGNRLYFTLATIQAIPDGGPFGFKAVGTKLVRVDNPLDPPEQWHMTFLDLSADPSLLPAVGAEIDGEWVDFYASYQATTDGPASMVLVRVKGADLAAPLDHMQYLDSNGQWSDWSRGTPFSKISFKTLNVSAKAVYNPVIKKWVSFTTQPPAWPEGIGMQTSDTIEGPWSEPRWVYRFPEIFEGASAPKPQTVICYAVREHEHLRQENGRVLVLTYACNVIGDTVIPFIDNIETYLPKTVTLDLNDLGQTSADDASPLDRSSSPVAARFSATSTRPGQDAPVLLHGRLLGFAHKKR